MKKIFLFALFLFLINFALPKTVTAQSCCPDTGGSQYKYTYDPATQKCVINGPQGSVAVNSNCSSQQVCDTTTSQCKNPNDLPTPPPGVVGCGIDPAGRQFCTTTPYNYKIYCSKTQECDDYKKALQNPLQQQQQQQQQAPGDQIRCGGGNGIDTAIGCIPFNNINALAGFFLRWGIGIGGGIAFLFIVYAGFLILTSSGNPDRMKAGQELLTSAIGGLLLLIFSVFILKLIGVDILRLPI